jgi:hypothetical protein
MIQAVIAIPGAGATTRATSAVVVVGRASVPPAGANGYWQTLSDLTRALTRVSAIVHREVAANHVCTRSGSILSEVV